VERYIISGGGHPMAAGFSIETAKIDQFMEELDKVASPLLTEEILRKRIRIDMELPFKAITMNLIMRLKEFEPSGIGNPTPVFVTHEVNVLDAHPVGKEAKHLKMVLEKDGRVYDAIGFNMGDLYLQLKSDEKVDIAYNIEENEWNNRKMIQLKLKDIVIKE
jgi:single-stranded-DNA-specific exonuclease